MRAVADFQKYIQRIFDTPGGREVLGKLERQADERDRRIVRRHELVAQIAEAKRVKRDEVPKMDALVPAAEAALVAARDAFHKARVRREEVGRAAHNLHMRCYDDVRKAEGQLRFTADQRLKDAHDLLIEASAHWHHAIPDLQQRELHGEFMDAHYVITNQAEIDALKARVDASLKAMDALMLVAEPTENAVVATVEEANAAARPILAITRRFFS